MKFVCVIPAYKPDYELISFLKKLIENDFLCVVVNDGSGMEFDSIFMQLPDGVILLSHDKNRGKGSAIKTALAYIASNLPDAFGVVTADADGQHTIQAVTKARDMLIDFPNALILGGRRFDNQVPLRSRFGNFVTRNVFALANNKYVYDTQTGLRAFSTSKIKEFLKIEGDKYEYEMNMLMFAARSGIEIKEFPIATIYIDNNKSSHFNPVKDSLKIFSCIAKYSLSSFLSFLIDFALFALLIFLTKGLGQTQSILIIEVGTRSVRG
ncbi:MAG: glycosyltransferase family 2 protein, partial [Clostridiales bacterium]|nr:glycosyltransferase family 2 protein [Clostridiales bacterium]